MKRYINLRTENHSVETVDEFDTIKETVDMLAEYRLGDPSSHYYMSPRCTNEWRMRAIAQHTEKYLIDGTYYHATIDFDKDTLGITWPEGKAEFALDQYMDFTGDMLQFIKRRVINERA